MSIEYYLESVMFFRDVVDEIGAHQWEKPALGEWTVRDLVGHTSRSLTALSSILDNPGGSVDISSPAQHYRVSLADKRIHATIAERGRQAGLDLGQNPAQVIHEASENVTRLMKGIAESTVVQYNNGGITLADYLATRVIEIAVHSLDLAKALGLETKPSDELLRFVLRLLADLALDSDCGGDMALIATGRIPAKGHFSVFG